MRSFSVDWLGRCGPHHLVVKLTPDEFRDRLEMSLVSESLVESMFALQRRYTGEINGNTFMVHSCWRSRRARPTLTGKIEKTEEGTRIQFQVHADPWFAYGMLMVGVGALIVVPVFMFGFQMLFPFCLVPIILPGVAILSGLFARYESDQLLQFFVDLVEEDRLA